MYSIVNLCIQLLNKRKLFPFETNGTLNYMDLVTLKPSRSKYS